MRYTFRSETDTVYLNPDYRLMIISSSGIALDDGECTLTADVRRISDGTSVSFPDSCFTWTRNEPTFTPVIGKTLELKATDLVDGSATFICRFKKEGLFWDDTATITISERIDGEDARLLQLNATGLMFSLDSDGKPKPSQSIILTAVKQNISEDTIWNIPNKTIANNTESVTIYPYDMGYRDIAVTNLVADIAPGNTRVLYGKNPGYYNFANITLNPNSLVQGHAYYCRYDYLLERYNSENEPVDAFGVWFNSGAAVLKRLYDAVIGSLTTLSFIATANYEPINDALDLYAKVSVGTSIESGFDSKFKDFLFVDLTSTGLLEYLESMGITDINLQTQWCDENLPFIEAADSISISVGNDTGMEAIKCTITAGSFSDSVTISVIRDGENGESYTVLINSTNGNVFRLDNVSTTLSCQVLKNTEDITDTLEEWRFTWKRKTSDVSGDEQWNTSSKAIGHKSIDITENDCYGRTVFTASVDLGDGTVIRSA